MPSIKASIFVAPLLAALACTGSASQPSGAGGATAKGGAGGGQTGAAGQTGSAGTAGRAGTLGASGTSGGAIGSGAAGATGVAGQAGIGGASGTNGTGGTNGVAGSVGAAGTTGGAGGGVAGRGGSSGVAGGTGGTGAGGTGAQALSGFVCGAVGGKTAQQLFTEWYGQWFTDHYVTCGTDMARVKGCTGPNNTCSEAIGYGLLLTVAAGDQSAFDRLNRFRKALGTEYNKAFSSGGLMAWSSGDTCPPTAGGGNANNAPDGDLDSAMALIQAGKRWPTGSYKTEATALIDAIWTKNVGTTGGKLYLGAGTSNLTDKSYASYWALGYFQVFARYLTDASKQQNWRNLATRGYEILKAAQSDARCAGEFPESVKIDGTIWDGDPCDFGYDSCRVPWRLAADYAWFGTADSKTMLDLVRTGVVKGDPAAAARQTNSAFVGGLALSAVSSDQATMTDYCTKWVNAKTAGGAYDDNPYFQKTLAVIYMLVAAGLFDRVVAP